LKVKVNESDYQSKVEEKLKEYSKKAQIKGFRPGKVPVGLVKKMYGTSILVDEVNHLLSHKISDYIKEQELKLVGDPIPDSNTKPIDWDNQKEFEFDYKLGLVDDFKVDISSKLKVTKYETAVDDKAIESTLDDLKEQYAETENPESSEEGDTINGVLSEVGGDYSHEGTLILSDLLKKELKKFVGLKVGDTVVFNPEKALAKSANTTTLFGQEEPADKNKDFEFKVTQINRAKPAEINQELFDKIFGKDQVTDLDAFKAKIKETLEQNYVSHSENLLSKEIREELIKATKIELPDEFLKEWLLLTNEKLTKEDIEKEYDLYAADLRWNLITNKISEEHKVEVNQEEVIEQTKDMMRQQFGGGALPEQIESSMDTFADNYLKGENGNNYMRMYNQIMSDKIFDLIKGSAKISSKKVKLEEFKNMS